MYIYLMKRWIAPWFGNHHNLMTPSISYIIDIDMHENIWIPDCTPPPINLSDNLGQDAKIYVPLSHQTLRICGVCVMLQLD